MKEQRGIWQIIWIEMSKSFVWFWSILLGFIVLGIALSMIYEPSEVIFQTNAAMYIYFAVIGAQLFKLGLNYGSTMGSTRHQLYTGVVLSALVLAAIGTAIHSVVYYSFGPLAQGLTSGMDLIHLLGLLPVEETVFTVILFDFSTSLMALGLSFAFSILYYKYGGLPLMIAGGVVALSVMYSPIRNSFWGEIVSWIMTGGAVELFAIPLVFAALAFSLPYLLVVRLNIYLKESASLK
ncbi:hypothetical protein [Alteribacter natronophilus]|uniref:hypothetical protein n=1 Tax=Alteribacter natronophilus TaxID=2583810 RepID=UPI00110E8A82|nr:hypothetical protein [Alteribacter natronophilus]TMW71056.1 hypothetical protein FGB90_13890 [Alteribacter natronophilus]